MKKQGRLLFGLARNVEFPHRLKRQAQLAGPLGMFRAYGAWCKHSEERCQRIGLSIADARTARSLVIRPASFMRVIDF